MFEARILIEQPARVEQRGELFHLTFETEAGPLRLALTRHAMTATSELGGAAIRAKGPAGAQILPLRRRG